MYTNIDVRLTQALLNKPRSGWLARGIPLKLAETVAVHSRNVAWAAYQFCSHYDGLDRIKMTDMGLVHDLAEYKVKDYRPGEIEHEEKHFLELAALKVFAQQNPKIGRQVLSLWLEYENNQTAEAQIMHQLDKLDASVTSLDYECNIGKIRSFYEEHPEEILQLRKLYPVNDPFEQMVFRLKEFHDNSRKKLENPLLIFIFEQLIKREFHGMSARHEYMELIYHGGPTESFRESMRQSSKPF